MNLIGKLGVIVFWTLVFGASLQLFAEAWNTPILILGLVTALGHIGEAALFQKQIKKYPGPYWQSLMLTLIFGLFHLRAPWRKAADQA